jgi:hypothetical protein
MRAKEITDVLLEGISQGVEDIFVNFANADMVAHAMTAVSEWVTPLGVPPTQPTQPHTCHIDVDHTLVLASCYDTSAASRTSWRPSRSWTSS